MQRRPSGHYASIVVSRVRRPIPKRLANHEAQSIEERGVREASRMTPEASTNKTTGEGSRLECGLVSYRSLASFLHAGKKSVQDVLL